MSFVLESAEKPAFDILSNVGRQNLKEIRRKIFLLCFHVFILPLNFFSFLSPRYGKLRCGCSRVFGGALINENLEMGWNFVLEGGWNFF